MIVMAMDPSSSNKVDRQYKELREQGMSKAKAARIASASRGRDEEAEGPSPNYEEWAKKQLYDRARQFGIEGRSDMSKAELCRALRDH